LKCYYRKFIIDKSGSIEYKVVTLAELGAATSRCPRRISLGALFFGNAIAAAGTRSAGIG
jgi:hypothetical protein